MNILLENQIAAVLLHFAVNKQLNELSSYDNKLYTFFPTEKTYKSTFIFHSDHVIYTIIIRTRYIKYESTGGSFKMYYGTHSVQISGRHLSSQYYKLTKFQRPD